ncbi:MAG: hypothetical protein HC800_14070, partial [Phormidesmis sp. RL_2_1]|nr:hypothetical protein [Phormidesmis sp. RL_2_1]
MRRLLLISLVTIPLAGCQFFGGSGDESVVDVIEAIEEDDGLASAPTIPAVPDVAGGATATPDGEAFAEPVVESKGTIVASTDLIRSTDPAARTRQVQRNRIDPFANLPIPPTPKPSATNKTGGSGSASGAADRSAAAGA